MSQQNMAKKEGKTPKSTLPCLPEDFLLSWRPKPRAEKSQSTQSKIKSTWEGGTINTTNVACSKVRYSLPHSPLAWGKRKEGMKENISVSIYLSIWFWWPNSSLSPANASLEDRRNFITEMTLMKEIGKHLNIVSILGCVTTGGPMCLITEYCPHGDLRSYLRRIRDKVGGTRKGRVILT